MESAQNSTELSIESFESRRLKFVQFLFSQFPDLAEIGTPNEYVGYLETVFPDSMFPNIAFHGTSADFKDEGFKPMKPNFDTLNSIEGVYNFTSSYRFAQKYGNKVYAALLDVRHPIEESTPGEYVDDMDRPLSEALLKIGKISTESPLDKKHEAGYENTDAVINHLQGEGYLEVHPRTSKEYGIPPQTIVTVFSTEQIHILGSKTDRVKFNTFINSK